MDFDYAFYLDKYPDLRHFTKEQAYNHWVTCGIKEGRICKKKFNINNTTNITIIIHLFHEELLADLLNISNRCEACL